MFIHTRQQNPIVCFVKKALLMCNLILLAQTISPALAFSANTFWNNKTLYYWSLRKHVEEDSNLYCLRPAIFLVGVTFVYSVVCLKCIKLFIKTDRYIEVPLNMIKNKYSFPLHRQVELQQRNSMKIALHSNAFVL